MAVTARLEGRDLGSAVQEVKKTVARLKIPSTIRVEYGGTYQEQQRSFHDLMVVLALGSLLSWVVFPLMSAQALTVSTPA